MHIGKAIKLCRERKGLTRLELAASSQVSPSYITLLENSKRDPSVSKVKQIADGLQIPLSVLFFLATDKHEFESISPELAEKLSLFTLKLIERTNDEGSLDLFP